MKKFLTLFFAVVVYVLSFAGCAYAIQGKWFNPQYLKAYIQPGNKRTVQMKHAFTEWSQLTQNKFIFYFVDEPQKAQIEVNFVKSIPNADREIGLTKTSMLATGKMVHAQILIAERTAGGMSLGDDAVYTVMLHEIGHAMGILDHSKDPLSIMYPSENDDQEIAKSDIQTLAKIYSWK